MGCTSAARRMVCGAGLGEPEVADLALLHELGHRADGLLDRRLGVDAVLVVEVDGVHAEALERRLARLAHVAGVAADAEELAVLAAHVAELRGDQRALPAPLAQRAADEPLVGERAVHVGGVEQCRPELERAVDGAHRLALVGRPVELRHPHAAEAERSRLEALAADPALVAESHPPHYRIGSMAQAHGDRLTATDASFLAQEGPSSHMHVGAVMIFEGPPPGYDEFVTQIRSRLHLVPRYRQKLAFPPLETGRPVWIDDPSFNLEYHIRHTALPAPGSEGQLRALAARIHSQQLDRAKPLWETWLVQGLEGNRFALISKTHHAVVDGVAGVDLATVLFDAEPTPPPLPHEGEPWRPQPEPSGLDLAARGIRGMVRTPFELAGRAAAGAPRPAEGVCATRVALESLGVVPMQKLKPGPESPVQVPVWPHRRGARLRCGAG